MSMSSAVSRFVVVVVGASVIAFAPYQLWVAAVAGRARYNGAVQRALFAFALGAFALHALGGCDEAKKRMAPVGTVIGYVKLEEGAGLPMYPVLMLGHEPLRPRSAREALPAECETAAFESRMPVLMADNRGLSGVVIAASDFRRERWHEPASHRVRIEHCALHPQTIAMSEGDHLVLENLDAFPFAPLYGPAYEATPLAHGQRLFVPTSAGTIEPLSCSSDSPCGRSDVFVFRHHVHAVSDALGAFRITDFPAGEQVRLTAIHPLLEDAETSVWVEPGKQARVELRVRPKPRFMGEAK